MTSYSETTNYQKICKIYNYKLKKLELAEPLQQVLLKFWQILPKNYLDQIDKASFLRLFGKIYRIIFPVYNYAELPAFLENEWLLYAKESSSN